MNNTRNIYELFDVAVPLKEDNLFIFYDSSSNTYKNFRLSDMYEDIYETFIATQRISSMAFETSSDYASSIHDHDNYNYVTTDLRQSGYPIVTIIDRDKETTFRLKASQASECVLSGQLGFLKVSKSKKTIINVSSDQFDGWVYADGNTYDARQFRFCDNLIRLFPSVGRYEFTVPLISGDIRINNRIDTNGCIHCVQEADCVETDPSVNYMVYIGEISSKM